MPERRRIPCVPIFYSLAILLVTDVALAQAPFPTRTLTTPDATYAEPFTSINSARELRDGRVVVSDGRDRVLQVVDLRTGAMKPVGRSGSGPAEWGLPGRLFEMPGDSTLMVDYGNGRFLIILPDGTPGPTLQPTDIVVNTAGALLGIDAQGRMIFERELPYTMNDGATGTVQLIRYDRARSRVDTVAQIAGVRGENSGARTLPGGFIQRFTNRPLSARDRAVVASDGRIAIVRHATYAVEWIAPDGARSVGPNGPASNIRVSKEEKDAFIRAQIQVGQIVVAGAGGGPPGARGSGGAVARQYGGDISSLVTADMAWPDVKPPFLAGAARAARDGRIWVLRSRAHNDPVPAYDIFDHRGRVVERVLLPQHTRLVGFGQGVLYLARTDDDELQHLERYRIP